MATILVPGAASVDIIQMMNGNYMVNTLNFTRVDEEEFEYADLVDLVDNVVFDYVNAESWHGSRNATWSTVLLRAKSLADPTISYERTDGMPIVGGSTGPTANQNALVLTLYTAENTRNTRGRLYIGGIYGTGINNFGLWTSTIVSTFRNALDSFALGAYTEGYQLVVVSRYLSGSPRATGITTPVLNVVGRAVPGSMATRRIGRGA